MIKGLRCSGSTQSRPHTVLSAMWKVMVRSCSMNPARLWAPQHRSSPLSPCSHSEPRAMGTGGCRWVLPWRQQHWAPLLFFWRTNPGMASSEQWVPPGPHHQRVFSAKKRNECPAEMLPAIGLFQSGTNHNRENSSCKKELPAVKIEGSRQKCFKSASDHPRKVAVTIQ